VLLDVRRIARPAGQVREGPFPDSFTAAIAYYSITSSARAIRLAGNSRPVDLAMEACAVKKLPPSSEYAVVFPLSQLGE
jgi:hypothetical protein